MTFADLLHKGFSWVYNNKQSILGTLVTALAFVQASPEIRNLVSTSTYSWLMFGTGLLMVVFARSATGGAVVSKVLPPSIPPKNPESGFVRPLVLGLLLAIGAVGVTALPGCQTLEQAQPTTTQERLVVANESVNAVVVSATASLNAGAISVSTAEAVSTSAREAQKWLTLAEKAFQDGAAADGEKSLAVAETLLRSLRALLAGGEA